MSSLPDITRQAINKKGIQKLIKQGIKALIFYGITMTFLWLSEDFRGNPIREAQPNVFWVVFSVLLILPVLYFKFYRFLLRPTFYAKVTKLENDSRLGGRKGDIRGFIARGHFVEMGRIDICFVTVETNRGKQYKFTYPREKAAFARNYYQVGDDVFCPALANYPFNENRTPEKPFCLCCGEIATVDETECSKCKVPLIQ